MAQIPYRGNLSSKAFPFLSTQFGQSVIVSGADQQSYSAIEAGGDINIPQAYYMHNVIPTAQGYKSVGYKPVLYKTGINFDRVIPIRDPDMTRGWLGITSSGRIYMFIAGEGEWTDVTNQIPGGWPGGDTSVAYVSGYTYLCISNYSVYKLTVATKTVTRLDFAGVIDDQIVAITAAANYLILTDGVKIYWSSTISPEDFVPSLITGAGSGTPNDVEGRIVALAPTSNGFAIYTSVSVVIAAYTQNARFPWVFKLVPNSKGVSNTQHIGYAGDEGANYAWTSAGLQRISSTGAVTVMPEVTDFLASQEFEDFNPVTNTFSSSYLDAPLRIKVAFIGARYLVISYGVATYTHALIYDTSLKRWGKLKRNHTACFEVSLNTDGELTTSKSASAKKTVGLVSSDGQVVICDFTNNAEATDSVLILGKFQLTRSRMTTLEGINVECVDSNNTSFDINVLSSVDGKTLLPATKPMLKDKADKFRSYVTRVTALNHSLVIKGKFNLNSFELMLHVNGRR